MSIRDKTSGAEGGHLLSNLLVDPQNSFFSFPKLCGIHNIILAFEISSLIMPPKTRKTPSSLEITPLRSSEEADCDSDFSSSEAATPTKTPASKEKFATLSKNVASAKATKDERMYLCSPRIRDRIASALNENLSGVSQDWYQVFKDRKVTSVTYVEVQMKNGRTQQGRIELTKVGRSRTPKRPTQHRNNRNEGTHANTRLTNTIVAHHTVIVKVLREGKRGSDKAINASRKSEDDTVQVLLKSSLGSTVCNADMALTVKKIRGAGKAVIALIVMTNRRKTFIYVLSTRLVSYLGGTVEEMASEEDVIVDWRQRKYKEEFLEKRTLLSQQSKPVATSNAPGMMTSVFVVHNTDGRSVNVRLPGTTTNYIRPRSASAKTVADIRGCEQDVMDFLHGPGNLLSNATVVNETRALAKPGRHAERGRETREKRKKAGLNVLSGNPLKEGKGEGSGAYVVWTTEAVEVLYECAKSKNPIYWRGRKHNLGAIATRLNEVIKPLNLFDRSSIGGKLGNDKADLEAMANGETRRELWERKKKRKEIEAEESKEEESESEIEEEIDEEESDSEESMWSGGSDWVRPGAFDTY